MSRVQWVSGCAFFAIAAALFPTIVAAQDDNPFGPAEGEGFGRPQVAPAELEPEPALAPAPAIDPAPAGEIALPAVADAPAGAPNEFCRCVGEESIAQSVVRIRTALRSPLRDSGLKFDGVALETVIGAIQEQFGIPIQLDMAALNDLGVQSDQPVTVNLSGISLRSALRLMLKQLGLTYVIEDEVVLITTPDQMENKLKTCVYDVRGLVEKLPMPKGASAWADYNPLIGAITECVATETWAENGGGEANIRSPGPGFLVISQIDDVHEDIRELLAALRDFRRQRVAEPVERTAENAGARVAAPSVDDASVVTRSYYLQINQQPGGETFAPKIRELITLSLPDEQWAGRLDSGEPIVLTVLPDRVVLRHRQSVQNKVQSLLTDSGLSSPPTPVAGEMGSGMGGGGFGGGGGGFFSPEPSERQ